jgi:uncharacterized protein YjbJ (UPF0337 family)
MTDKPDRSTERSLEKEGLKDSLAGKAREVKGKIKDAMGGLTGDSDTQVEGKVDEVTGKVQDAWGKTERNTAQNMRDMKDEDRP